MSESTASSEQEISVEVRKVTSIDDIKEAESLFDKPIKDDFAEKFLAAEGHHLLLAYEGTKPIGMVTGVEMTHPDKGTELFIYELGVDETFRGRGVGSKLVNEVIALARQRGCYGVWTLTETDNEAAQATYHKVGGAAENGTVFTWGFEQ